MVMPGDNTLLKVTLLHPMQLSKELNSQFVKVDVHVGAGNVVKSY